MLSFLLFITWLSSTVLGLLVDRNPNTIVQFPYEVFILLLNETYVKYTAGIDMTLKDLIYYEADASFFKVNGTVKLYNIRERKWVADLSDEFIEVWFSAQVSDGDPPDYDDPIYLESLQNEVAPTRDEAWDWFVNDYLPIEENELV